MTVNQLRQVAATRPMKGCLRSFDRIAHSGMFLPCFAGYTPTAHRLHRRFQSTVLYFNDSAVITNCGQAQIVGLRSTTWLELAASVT